ncbi:hypothetical protein DQ04_00391060 [Trypanosoma grayi]|uniref:hypothetical protein n=1 Tax=Trypanosoma grayi TaxID=71804 RepID=UPI0004F423EB|nr:hypothetical protein DQ04_00391060 [Trypanosoma grayi]KEG14584.1 hypothetical protein DQ04_00391060 [Trypanosoma grayi]
MPHDQQLCDGCGKIASSFQCPLCQAEAVTDRGFFCTQECFAKNWLGHRGSFHKSGVVRAKPQSQSTKVEEAGDGGTRKRSAKEVTAVGDSTKKKLRVSKEGHEESEVKMPIVVPWHVLPSVGCGNAKVVPSLSPGVPRVVVGGSSSDRRIAFWSAAVAASHHIAAELAAQDKGAPLHVLAITSSPLAAHAMAWALRCTGLAGALKLAVSAAADDLAADPSAHFTGQRQIVVTTQDVARRVANGTTSAWLPGEKGLLVTLPGVADAADFQAVHTRAVFFVHRNEASASPEESWCAEEEVAHHVTPLSDAPSELHNLLETAAAPASASSIGENCVVPVEKPVRFDNDVSTSLARGDLSGALQHLVRLYSTHRGVFEEILANSFLSAVGAASVAHAHHIVAYAARHLVDHSTRFKGPQGGTLKEMSLRALSKVVRLFPPIIAPEDEPNANKKMKRKGPAEGTKESANSSGGDNDNNTSVDPPSAAERDRLFNYYDALPNLQLQATLCHLYPHASPNVIDTLGAAWGVKKILRGPDALKQADQRRKDAVRRLQSRYGSKLGPAFANYLVVLMHFLYDAVAGYSLAVDGVEQRLLWSLTLEGEVGPLHTFLSNCFLLPTAEPPTETKETTAKKLSSRQLTKKPVSRTVLLRMLPVRTASAEETLLLPWVLLPLAGQRKRDVERLQRQAVEEILMAMPRKPRPMYIGDVGNLIGKWFRFNSRFDGALGVSLMEFLTQHPEAFRVVGNLVTRRTAGVADQVKMRFDDDSGDDDDDDDDDKERKAKDRALLTGARSGKGAAMGGKDLPARARKKAMVKAFNKSRFNRNYKPIDPSAKVPGYVKHAPRKVKGRGRKANKRTVKRG